MSYIIRKTNGDTLGTILDGTIDTARTSLTLVGRNYSNYGQIMTDNLVKLLENFAYNIAPSNPIAGQLWWDTNSTALKVYTGASFKIISSATAASIGPTTTIAGDIWWDTTNEQLYVYNGLSPYSASGWILVGPSYKKNFKSGAIWETIGDTSSAEHQVVALYLNGVRTGIISTDATFTPNASVTGFTTISRGYNMYSGGTFQGTANNASYLGNVAASTYLRSDTSNTTSGNLTVATDSGITIGAGLDLALTVTDVDVSITNRSSGGDINFYATVSGVATKLLTITGTGEVEVSDDPTTTFGVASKRYVDNKFVNSVLTGVPVAPTMPAGTANTALATTEFVVSNSGLLKNKIYDSNSYLEIVDTGVAAVILNVDGNEVLTASASGVNLLGGATAITQSQTFSSTGDSAVATTDYVKTATQWWGGSAKFVSTSAPQAGVNDAGSRDGDFWFQYTS